MDHVADRPHLVVIGSGGQPYREYAYASLARRYRLSAVLAQEPTWQRPFLGRWSVTDLRDPAGTAAAVVELAGDGLDVGILTWDETVLECTAQAAEKLGLPHMSATAAARCRDKFATRTLLAEAGVAPVRHLLAHSADAAVAAADDLGYPVVVKPRALAGSMGVALCADAAAVREAFRCADGSHYADLPTGHGVLVEEYLDGPEISIDSVAFAGRVDCVHVARKRLGYQPYFEEVGHLVTGWSGEPWADAVRALVVRAHDVLGVTHGVTHAEVRLTSRGPRLVELNGRLGGDLIPFVGTLATGVDLVVAAAEIAFGRRPDLTPSHDGTAEIAFVYPPSDCTVGGVDVTAAARVPGIAHATVLAPPGTVLHLPPVDPIPRLAALVATGATEADCARILTAARAEVVTDLRPVPEMAVGFVE